MKRGRKRFILRFPIQGFVGLEKEESDALLLEFSCPSKRRRDYLFRINGRSIMLVMWDNRALFARRDAAARDGHDRLLHRTTIADTRLPSVLSSLAHYCIISA